ncbi:unnamed protein product [Strongylus vulgaris]|uniref:Uncharacterized protein n=1 Tax=Strongylus vulgaris TaxID=40348 RepID=A0A3P7ITX4_STRVU|nr:unnamed protein product [Strongylus vulgaris]
MIFDVTTSPTAVMPVMRRIAVKDYLKNFELIGTLKIADKITEIWTYIPHVQGVRLKLLKNYNIRIR